MNYDYDVIIYDDVGAPFTKSLVEANAIGGSEYALVQLAQALGERGFSVLCLNRTTDTEGNTHGPDGNVVYTNIDGRGIMLRMPWHCKALVISRYSPLPPYITADEIVVSATDIYGNWHAHQERLMQSDSHGRNTLICVSEWQASTFPASWKKVIIPAMLDDYIYEAGVGIEKNLNKFVYASAVVKGWKATFQMWKKLKEDHPEALKDAELHVTTPGYDAPSMLEGGGQPHEWKELNIFWKGFIPPRQLAAFMADAAGLFYVNTMPETFCAVAAIAEAVGCRCHILLAGSSPGGIPTTVNSDLVHGNRSDFEADFVDAYKGSRPNVKYNWDPNNFRVSKVIEKWIEVLGLKPKMASAGVFGVIEDGVSKATGFHVGDKVTMFEKPIPEGAGTVALVKELTKPEPAKEVPWNSVFIQFQKNLEALPIPTVGVSPNWQAKCAQAVENSKTKPLLDFLVWNTDLDMCEMDVFHPWFEAVSKAKDPWRGFFESALNRFQVLAEKSASAKTHSYSRNELCSPVSIQHAYHLLRFEARTGTSFWNDVDAVVEVGGGYGNFARMLRRDGFKKHHFIIDLPHTREFQRLFLTLNGIVTDQASQPMAEFTDRVHLLDEFLIPSLLEFLEDKKVAFVSTWGLSECPLVFRCKLFPRLHKNVVRYLISSQWTYEWNGIDNRSYFSSFMKEAEKTNWVMEPIHGFETEMYLFGYQKRDFVSEGVEGVRSIVEETMSDVEKIKKKYSSPKLTRLVPETTLVTPRNQRRWEKNNRTTVGLVMIAKNEAKVLPRVLSSVLGMIDTYTILLDDKNDDNSQQVIYAVMGDVPGNMVPGRIFHGKPFTGLADARNEAISAAAYHSDYLLMIDADDMYVPRNSIEDVKATLNHLTHDGYEIEFDDGGVSYYRTQLFRGDKGFRFEGVAHEFLVDPPGVSKAKLPCLIYKRLGGGFSSDSPKAVKRKYMRDVGLFETQLASDPDDSRSQYYLAQSFKDASGGCEDGDEKKEFLIRSIESYRKRAFMGGYYEEKFLAWINVAKLSAMIGKPEDTAGAFLNAIEIVPSRIAEPCCYLAEFYNGRKQHALAYSFAFLPFRGVAPGSALQRPEGMLVDKAVYEWHLKFQLALAGFYLGGNYKELSGKLFKELLTQVPPEQVKTIENNLAFFK